MVVKRVDWFFGRGLSIACNLSWTVPKSWKNLEREQKVENIKNTLKNEMEGDAIDCSIIKAFLEILSEHTAPEWRHCFITTNWDYLLQREILALNLRSLPKWLANSHVFHLNGTVEELNNNSNRSPFLLEEDPPSQRIESIEANMIYNQIIWNRTFIVVGMSFECETDQFLLNALGKIEDDLPIGNSSWLIINPDTKILLQSCNKIKNFLPRASIFCIANTFNEWVKSGCPELHKSGILVDKTLASLNI